MNWFKISQYSRYDVEGNLSENIDTSKIIFKTEQNPSGISRKVFLNNKKIGEIEVLEDKGLEKSSKKLFSNYIDSNDKVLRFYGIYLSEQFRNKGIGKKMFMDIFKLFPDTWFGNSELGYGGTDFAAIHALESLIPQIELHWLKQKGGQWVARLAKQSKGGKEINKYFGSGFYLMPGYVKGGGAEIKAFTTEEAIDRFANEKDFFPTYIYLAPNNEAVLDVPNSLTHKMFEIGREIIETRDKTKINDLVQIIKNNIIK